jgi:hypothetical protein
MTINSNLKNYIESLAGAVTAMLLLVGCASDSVDTPTDNGKEKKEAIAFDTYVPYTTPTSRATYPSDTSIGDITDSRLKTVTFGVFAQSTYNTAWSGYTKSTPFNFMWNQQVLWDGTLATPAWTYEPVKYWPNDNNPADDQGATGSLMHSYLSFFAYAPYTNVAAPGSGFDKTGEAGADGIIKVVANTTNVADSYIYYRTSNEKPFGVDESVDLLWATKQDCYKYDSDNANDYGRVTDRVPLVFKHALTKLSITVRALIDQTSTHSSPAYSTIIDENSKLFVDTVSITTPHYYSEGKLKITPTASPWDTPTWDYTGVAAGCEKDGFYFGSETSTKNVRDDVSYSLRWTGNPPDRSTPEEAKDDFDALTTGVTSDVEQQLPADYSMYMFCPTTTPSDISDITIRTKYYVVTYDPSLTLNNPKYYSIVKNDIKASLGNTSFKFEPNKQYKIVLNLGLTSVKFDIYVLDDNGEYVLLSAVVKDWDLETREADVE